MSSLLYTIELVLFGNPTGTKNPYFHFCRSSDAKYLALSSRDGYCTIIEFEDEELGQPHTISGICYYSFFYVFSLSGYLISASDPVMQHPLVNRLGQMCSNLMLVEASKIDSCLSWHTFT